MERMVTQATPPGTAHYNPSPLPIRDFISDTHAEIIKADSKAASLLTVVGIVFAAFSLATAAAATTPTRGLPRWLAIASLIGVLAATEFLFLAIRPKMSWNTTATSYFGYWRLYANRVADLCAELSCTESDARLLVQLSVIAWRKFLLIRTSVDVLLITMPVVSSVVGFTLVARTR